MRLPRVIVLAVFMGFFALRGYAQLSDLHYLPPLKQRAGGIVAQLFYLSTPDTTAFDVKIYLGTNTTPIATISGLKNSAYKTYNPGNNDNNKSFVTDANTGTVLTSSGLRFESDGGQLFYVNFRGNSTHQATSLTSKGRAALGLAFKWGGIPNKGNNLHLINSTVGIMATENNTTVNIFGYDPACTFRSGTNEHGITANSITITLNKGESYVLEAIQASTNHINIDGWLGASIQANKKIAVSVGELHFQPFADNGQDVGMDQIIPENTLGKEYVFIRGNGTDVMEFPVIIATQNGTQIFVNGESNAIATIDNGDYFAIPSSKYSSSSAGANMYVFTSKEAYAFQAMAGASAVTTADINFIAPVNCLLSNKVDFIPDISDMAGKTITGAVSIIASAAISEQDIIVTHGGVQLSTGTLTSAKKTLNGSNNWKTYFLSGLSGDVSVSANGPIAVGFFGFNGAAGASGYFSGFETIPAIEITNSNANGCLPYTTLSVATGFTAYAWYREGALVTGATSNTFTPTLPGNYTVVVTNGDCTYESSYVSVYDCNPEIVLGVTTDNAVAQSRSTVIFTVKVKYFGYSPVSNVSVSNTLPGTLIYVSNTLTAGSFNETSKVWNIGTMYPGEEKSLTVTTTVDNISSSSQDTFTIASTQTFSTGSTEANTIADDFTEIITAVPTLSNPGLSIFSIPSKTYFTANFQIPAPTTSSSGAITYTSSNPQVATISGNVISIQGSGTSSIVASQAADTSFYSGTITTTLMVTDVNVLTKYGRVAVNIPNYVNNNGGLNDTTTLTSNGAIWSTINPQPIVSSGLVMHLDAGNVASYSGSGTTWTDISGNGNHGTLINGVGFTSSNNGALVFDGTNDYVSTPIDADLQAMPSTSWSGWFKRTGTSSNWQCIFGMEDSDWDRALFIEKNGYNLSLPHTNGRWETGASATPSAWNHVVVIYDNGTMRFYLNGVEYTTGTSEGNHSSNGTFTIGANQTGGIRYGGIIAQVLVYDRALTTAEVQQNYNADKSRFSPTPDGLTAANAGTSAYQIKKDYPSSTDGLYWIANSNIISGTPFQIYADMTTDGGGWTLIMTNSTKIGWSNANAIALNTGTPSITSNYSIIGWADYIKRSASGFQYMIDAGTRGSFGGIWTANGDYSFTKTDNTQTNVTRNKIFGNWDYHDEGIEERMPWYSPGNWGLITTSLYSDSIFWGTLITTHTHTWSPAPYISKVCAPCNEYPGIIWYWVR